MPAGPWDTRVNASALSGEARRLILEGVKSKLGFKKTLREFGIAGDRYTTTSTASRLYRITWFTWPSNMP